MKRILAGLAGVLVLAGCGPGERTADVTAGLASWLFYQGQVIGEVIVVNHTNHPARVELSLDALHACAPSAVKAGAEQITEMRGTGSIEFTGAPVRVWVAGSPRPAAWSCPTP